jgi:hypothetical protein
MKKILTLLLVLSILLTLPLITNAHDVPQDRSDCSIEVIVRYDGENVDGGTLTAIKVGYVDEDDGNYFFSQEFTNARMEDIASPNAPKTQKEFYNNNKSNHDFYTQTQTVKDGKATFSGLSTGVYLIVQNKAANGFSKMGAFLVSVPYMEDGEYQYHVTAAIKSELEREPEPTDPPPTEPGDPKLPQTGQLNWPIPLMVAAGLGFFVVGWVLCFGKKREQHEK